uniref:Uncharacterized protein n=1 Tax=Anguilla anguilla TaxID=7936 RepID=A0A0E9RNU0_ANGAN
MNAHYVKHGRISQIVKINELIKYILMPPKTGCRISSAVIVLPFIALLNLL